MKGCKYANLFYYKHDCKEWYFVYLTRGVVVIGRLMIVDVIGGNVKGLKSFSVTFLGNLVDNASKLNSFVVLTDIGIILEVVFGILLGVTVCGVTVEDTVIVVTLV